MVPRKEDKPAASRSSLPIAKETGMTINRICKFADGTFGIYGNIRKKDFSSPFLRVYSTNPLKLVDTFVSPTGDLLPSSRNPLKLQGDFVFLSTQKQKETNYLEDEETNRLKETNRLEIHNINNQKILDLTVEAEHAKFDAKKATSLNQSYFAVPFSCLFSGAHSIFVFELNQGKIELIHEFCLSQPIPYLRSSYPEKWSSPAFKEQAAKLPFTLLSLLHVERLTDDSFIVHGYGTNTPIDSTKDRTKVVLKCNIKDGSVTELLTMKNTMDRGAVRVLNSRQLVWVGDNEGKPYCQVWEVKQDEAKMQPQEPIINEAIEGLPISHPPCPIDLKSVQVLPGSMGVLFQIPKSSTSHDMTHKKCDVFLHLFGQGTVINLSNSLLETKENESVRKAELFVTKDAIVYANSAETNLHCYSLHQLARELRVKNRAPITKLHQTLSSSCGMSQSLADLVVSYCDIPNRVAQPLSITNCVERLFLILNDTEYFSGARADKIREVLKEKTLSPELLLNLKKIATNAQPQGSQHTLFDYDDRTEHEKIIFALFKEIKEFSDLQGLPRFDELQDDWYQFHNWPLRSVWKC